MKEIIQNALHKAYSYEEYIAMVQQLAAEGKSTGPIQSESLLHYSTLNLHRMQRLDKTITLSAELVDRVSQIQEPVIWLVISEGWCGDAAQILPILHKMAQQNSSITLQIVLRDENESLMDLFLTKGTRSIPKLIALTPSLEVRYSWGPRPSEATRKVEMYKEAHGLLDAEFKKDLQLWYAKNKGKAVQEDFMALLD